MNCRQCFAPLGRFVPGDVVMCTNCGQWHMHVFEHDEDGAYNSATPIWPRTAAELAREPVPLDQLCAAYAAAEDRMEVYCD